MGKNARTYNKHPPIYYTICSGAWFGILQWMNQERSTTNEWVIPTISSTREPQDQIKYLV